MVSTRSIKPMCAQKRLSEVRPSAAFQTAALFFRSLFSRPYKEDRLAFPLSVPLCFRRSMIRYPWLWARRWYLKLLYAPPYELIAYKLKACWWPHDDALYLYFVSNTFLFKQSSSALQIFSEALAAAASPVCLSGRSCLCPWSVQAQATAYT